MLVNLQVYCIEKQRNPWSTCDFIWISGWTFGMHSSLLYGVQNIGPSHPGGGGGAIDI